MLVELLRFLNSVKFMWKSFQFIGMRIYGSREPLKRKLSMFVSSLFYTDVVFTVSCNHMRATEFYIKTVTEDCQNPWTGHPCRSYSWYSFGFCNGCGDDGRCPLMGYRAEETKLEGEFFLNTDTWDTFCRELSLYLFPCLTPIVLVAL